MLLMFFKSVTNVVENCDFDDIPNDIKDMEELRHNSDGLFFPVTLLMA